MFNTLSVVIIQKKVQKKFGSVIAKIIKHTITICVSLKKVVLSGLDDVSYFCAI